MIRRAAFLLCLAAALAAAAPPAVTLSRADYEDRVLGAWLGQTIGTLLGFPFEHKPASAAWVDRYPKPYDFAPADDDYYYELVALRAFEKYGIGLTVEQLGRQWVENNAGAWGSSEQTRLLLARGVPAAQAGHPRYNRLWFTIGPQFSADIYGMVAPGMPNVAARLARRLGRINGHAEAVDGAVFVAGLVSLAFAESDSRAIVRQAARLIDPRSPYRQCLDQVISMAEAGKPHREITQAVEDRWHIEYPATNNAVANGGLMAAAVWFGGGDFLKTVNLAFQGGDMTDADCNAANAGAVAGAMRGAGALPAHLVAALNDRLAGSAMGGVKMTPPVEERISDIARRVAAVGAKVAAANGARAAGDSLRIPRLDVETQPAELFRLGDLMQYWNPEWVLERAGFGGAGGGMRGIRGMTYLDGDVLATYPRDEVRGLVLRRTARLGAHAALSADVAADPGRAWQLEVFAGNSRVFSKLIEGGDGNQRRWQTVRVPLDGFAGEETTLRLFQFVLVTNRAGNAYWRALRLE